MANASPQWLTLAHLPTSLPLPRPAMAIAFDSPTSSPAEIPALKYARFCCLDLVPLLSPRFCHHRHQLRAFPPLLPPRRGLLCVTPLELAILLPARLRGACETVPVAAETRHGDMEG
ncbi:hypothetical protein ZEAMMB73_Zm00001d017088 [Zea mays]|jgi:hypothetical protein|nr:unknown [Zea mays]AQK72256.1 hypothetical protein ZEAMMB73_Zm00001d017088 [Zea mays]|eukprot:NP_001169846.1 uncharacterized protein LOC100383738 [Zea mays]